MIRSDARLVALLLAFAARPAAAATPSVPTLSPDQLHAGQKAVVRTVFTGTRIEEFEAEIVGVLQGGRAEGDLILARATSERAVASGVAQGMSGSPVYVDGKLIGALSSGWSFSREPVFGITPIREMLQVLELPTQSTSGVSAGATGAEMEARSGSTRFGELAWDDEAGATNDRPATAPPVELSHLAVPLACGGLHQAALDVTRALFEPLGLRAVPGGRGGDGDTAALGPGAAVAVDMLRGDLHIAAIGTLTYRDGAHVLIFGHPLFQSGEVRLPLSTATITTIVASQIASFKLGAPGRPVGVLTQDRRAAVGGTLGDAPRLLPVSVSVRRPGTPAQEFHFESIEDRAMAPQLMAVAAINSLLESGGTGGNQTVRWTVRMGRSGAPPLVLSDVVSGESPVGELVGAVAAPLRFLYGNPFAPLRLDSVAVDLDVTPGREAWTLRGAEVLAVAVRPGGALQVRCEVERWRGGRETRTLVVPVPEEVPDGRYTLWLGGGPELSRFEAQRLPGRYRPASLDEAWRRLAAYRPSDGLYTSLVARAPEVTSDGRDYPELPTSALALLASGQRAGDRTRRGDRVLLGERRVPIPGTVRGELQLEVTVDSKAP